MLKKYGLLLGGFGFSYFGNWIYLIALNLLVLDLTGSAAAVAGIYIVGPAARILTSFIAGSIIDRSNKRRLMIYSDIIRGLLVCFVPFMGSLWVIYTILFISNMVGAFFGPSSTFFITKYVADEEKKRFNAWLGMLSSGAFLIGPAIAGVLIISVGTTWTIIVNGITFFVCALAISAMPDVDEEHKGIRLHIRIKEIASDYNIVKQFMKADLTFIRIYLVYQIALMLAFALDSQEVTFLKQDLAVSDQVYGLIISIAGIGSLIGSSVAAGLTSKLSLRAYFGYGLLLTMTSYTAFYASEYLWTALIAFIGLGFFMAFSNAGYETYYQRNVPTALMGRFGSVAALFQNIIQILFTFILGLVSEVFTLQQSAIAFGLISVACTLLLLVLVYSKASARHFIE